MEIFTSWMEEGLQQGLQQGKQELILQQLHRRLGEVSLELQNRIQGLSAKQLDHLGEDLPGFSTPTDLIAWLEQQ